MANLFALKRKRLEALGAAEDILSLCENQKRERTDAEAIALGRLKVEYETLQTEIKQIESQNTLSSMCGPKGFFGAVTPAGEASTVSPLSLAETRHLEYAAALHAFIWTGQGTRRRADGGALTKPEGITFRVRNRSQGSGVPMAR